MKTTKEALMALKIPRDVVKGWDDCDDVARALYVLFLHYRSRRTGLSGDLVWNTLKQLRPHIKTDDLCDELGISRSTYHRWRKGRVIAKAEHANALIELARRYKLKCLEDWDFDEEALADEVFGKIDEKSKLG